MPIYDFRCRECGTRCPDCGSENLERLISASYIIRMDALAPGRSGAKYLPAPSKALAEDNKGGAS